MGSGGALVLPLPVLCLVRDVFELHGLKWVIPALTLRALIGIMSCIIRGCERRERL